MKINLFLIADKRYYGECPASVRRGTGVVTGAAWSSKEAPDCLVLRQYALARTVAR